ncbi:class I SAM-dependent methyltransferase [Nitrincola tapanii]|uniref:Class I SAM-dependent methyltransferase n=1 Tax=Nitrincola tapanii TaxID=1708751 RepID=A0A5A9W3Q6_9GAMM|nr:methyltransferase domain-containing protein [Nitrincola tapanii]KAA0875163.1 class I SAM-dependent methyltransferase [Nitrincola tapanii]
MQEFDRRAHWENVYELKDAREVSWYQAEPVTSLELIARCGLDFSDPVIDVGAGASILVDHLLTQGYTSLSVLDISAAALAASRTRLGASAEAVNWIVSDVTAFSPEARFLLWHDRAVFHFLTEAIDRQRYVEVLKTALSVGGHLIIASFAVGGPEKCSGLPVVQYDAEKLKAELGEGFKLVEERSEEHLTPAQKVQKFTYFLFERVVENEM